MILLNDDEVSFDDVKTISWKNSLKVKQQITDRNVRTRQIRIICLHTVMGKLGKVLPGSGEPNSAFAQALYQTKTARDVSWDYTIALDGTVICQNDPLRWYTWHAGAINPISIGIEFDQLSNGDVYENQIMAGAKFVSYLCELVGIQKQIHMRNGGPYLKTILRLAGAKQGVDMVGVFAHSNQTENKPIGDCGPHIWPVLRDVFGFDTFDFTKDEDLAVWRGRQHLIGVEEDGIPLKNTVSKLKELGYEHGMWVNSPNK